MVVVSISETYDLRTVVDKMTLIGIHTPKRELIQKMYPGLAMNYRYFRILSEDVVLSTAQQLPLSVQDVGLAQDQVRPQDVMNPILYKACSNDSWSTLEARLQGLYYQTDNTSGLPANAIDGQMAFAENDGVTGLADEKAVYYSILSNRDGWKVAPVQSGLEMRGLRPLVFEKLYNFGENNAYGRYNNDYGTGIIEDINGDLALRNIEVRSMRGNAKPMPRMNTTLLTGVDPHGESASYTRGSNYQSNGMADGHPVNTQIQMPEPLPVMLGCIILPPVSATTGIIYYRMVTRCYIEFSEPRPMTEITSFADMNSWVSSVVYHSDYLEQSKKMDDTTDMVDVKNATIEKIMEGR